MALLSSRQIKARHGAFGSEQDVAVIDAAEFEAAQRDPRVRVFLDDADAYLAELERQGRNG